MPLMGSPSAFSGECDFDRVALFSVSLRPHLTSTPVSFMSSIISVTDRAELRIRHLMDQAPSPSHVLRVSVEKGGCSGFKYRFDYAEQLSAGDEKIEKNGIVLYVDPAAVLYIFGTELDFEDGAFSSRFVFNNPNAKGNCGCGESFTV